MDKVSQVFSNTYPHLFDNSLLGIKEGIEDVNFEDLALVHEHVLDFTPAVQEEDFIGVIWNPAPELKVQSEEALDVTLVTTETTT